MTEKPDDLDMGCSDGYCKLALTKRRGQHTNGGCRCLSHIDTELRLRIEKKLWYLTKERDELRDALRVAADQRENNTVCPECKVDDSHNWDCPYYAIEEKSKEKK